MSCEKAGFWEGISGPFHVQLGSMPRMLAVARFLFQLASSGSTGTGSQALETRVTRPSG